MAAKVTLTFLNSSLKGQQREFTRPGRVVLGRASDCDVQLPPSLEFMEVSRRHCELEINPPSVQVRDLGSRNGTFLNGSTVGQRPGGNGAGGSAESPWQVVKEGDELRLGDLVLRTDISMKPGREQVRAAAGGGGGLWPFFRLWSRVAVPH
jgi:pSer/pThr/pTyr-binding forkhead associated (FHA) protein